MLYALVACYLIVGIGVTRMMFEHEQRIPLVRALILTPLIWPLIMLTFGAGDIGHTLLWLVRRFAFEPLRVLWFRLRKSGSRCPRWLRRPNPLTAGLWAPGPRPGWSLFMLWVATRKSAGSVRLRP